MSALTMEKDCGCGCGGGKGECRGLECLVQPRFFCGQLLADQDLTAMVDWVKAKSALARFRHGWGVVCGLDVHCGRRGTVTVSPGYALDCCGRDLVICKDAKFDLSKCWEPREDPCGTNNSNKAARTARATFQTGSAAPRIDFGGLQIPEDQVKPFDLFVRYSESLTDARSALARGGCGGAAGCEYTRVAEGHELYCKPANLCDDPHELIVNAYTRRYVDGLDAVFNELLGIGVERRVERLLAYVRQHPLGTFCYVHEWLCDLERKKQPLSDEEFQKVAFWIVQDWRNAFFRLSCDTCGPESGVRLARIWVWRQPERNQDSFTTLHVDAYAPFRRELAKDDYPASQGFYNVGSTIWQPVETVVAQLRDAGFANIQTAQFPLTDVATLKTNLFKIRDGLYLVREGREQVVVQYWVDRCAARVVGYGANTTFDNFDNLNPTTTTAPAPAPTPRTRKR